MKKIIILVLILTNNLLFSQNTTELKENDSTKINRFLAKIDSLNYSEFDFNKMVMHFKDNKEIFDFMSKKSLEGDKNATDFLKLLGLNFSEAIDEIGERDVKTIIFSYYKSLEIKAKFEKLNSDFDKELDSLKLEKEYYTKEIRESQQTIDSLDNN